MHKGRRTRGWRRSAGLTMALTTAAAAQAQTVNPQGIPELVVTATRSETTIRETPVAVSSLTGDALKERHLVSIADLTALVPSLQVGTSTAETRIAIRGIGNNNFLGGADPGVAFHIDGVYIGTTGAAGNAFFDLARIEVLRGPQGTLFGRNATGGSVNLITAAPTREFAAEISQTVGVDPWQSITAGFVSGPVNRSGSLTARLSGTYNYNEGYTRNLADTGPRRQDDDNSFGIRAQLQYAPDADSRTRLILEYRRQDAKGAAQILAGFPAPTPPVQLGGRYADPNTRTVYANMGSREGEYLAATLNSQFSVGPGTLSLLGSVIRTTTDIFQEGDGTDYDFTSNYLYVKATQYYGELLYTVTPVEPLEIIAGFNAYHQDLYSSTIVPIEGFIFSPSTLLTGLKSTSFAVFGHARYRVLPNVTLFGGLRQTWDRKEIDEFTNFAGRLEQRASWPKLTYEVGVSAELAETVNVYVKYATGYKAGGYQGGNLTPAADPELNSTVEAGVKGLFFDRALEINLAGYLAKYRDMQVTQIVGFAGLLKNAARATNNGVELEMQVRPVPALRLQFSGAYQHAVFDEFFTEDGTFPELGLQDLSGNRLPSAPELIYSIGAYYSIPAGHGEITLGGRYYRQSRVYFTEFNIWLAEQAGVGRGDLSIDYETADGRWRASLFARNISNEVVKNATNVTSVIVGHGAIAELEPGRFIGLSVRRRF